MLVNGSPQYSFRVVIEIHHKLQCLKPILNSQVHWLLLSSLQHSIPLTIAESVAAVCQFYPKGTCSKGGACPFRHVRGDRTIVCKHWLRGLCKKGDQCEFLHEYDMSKMPECYFYSRFSKFLSLRTIVRWNACTFMAVVYCRRVSQQRMSIPTHRSGDQGARLSLVRQRFLQTRACLSASARQTCHMHVLLVWILSRWLYL